MRCLYYCTTPLQVMIAINMHYNQVLAHGYRKSKADVIQADIIIVDIFRNAKSIGDNLSDLGIFDQVYIISEEDHKQHKNGVKKIFGIAYDTLFPKRLLRQQFDRNSVEFLKNAYSVIVSSVFSHSVAALITMNRKAAYVMMDDGLASYFGDWTKRIRSSGYLALLKYRNFGVDISKPEALYVMRSDMCKSTLCNEIVQLPEFSASLLELYRKIFGFSRDRLNHLNSIIWLTQPSKTDSQKEVANNIYKCLLKHKENVSVRIHPREKSERSYNDFNIDKDETLWEIKLIDINIESSLLITLNSTAVMTPKLLYDKEPWVIFAYRLVGNRPSEQFEQVIDQLIESYADKRRICIAKDWEQFQRFVDFYSETQGGE